jgi:ABC-2 type transport system permease protein
MTSPQVARPVPGRRAAAFARIRIEFLQLRRSRETLFFTVAFPVLMLLLFGTIFSGQEIGPQAQLVSFPQYFMAGMVGSSVWSVCFQNLAVAVPVERDSGALKRLAGTPMPKSAYFIGKIVLSLALTVIDCALLIGLGVGLYHVQIPSVGDWVTFAWVLLLGVTACSLFGLAVAGLIQRGRTASTVVAPFAISLQFLSGVYFVFGDLPGWLQGVGGVFPLRWLTLGMRSVFLPEGFRQVEPQHTWARPVTAIVLAGWCLVGLAFTVRTFRWTPTRER